jgi:hypothetical protein
MHISASFASCLFHDMNCPQGVRRLHVDKFRTGPSREQQFFKNIPASAV